MKKLTCLYLSVATCTLLLLAGCMQDQKKQEQQNEPEPASHAEQVIQPEAEAPSEAEGQVRAQKSTEIAVQAPQASDAHVDVAHAEVPKSVSLADILPAGGNAIQFLQQKVAKGNVVIDFYAPWCGPCRFMAPIIDELANLYPDILFLKVDIDQHDDVLAGLELAGKKMDISGIPTFYFFKNGTVVDELHGGMKKENFEQRLKAAF